MSLLSTSDISLILSGQQILKDVSVEIEPGEIVGLIGPNGSGKTTFFNVLSGFLRPSKGTLMFHGKDITSLSAPERSRLGIGRVFQNFGIFREMTLIENVQVALESLPKGKRPKKSEIPSIVAKTLSMVGLQEHAKKKASSLSGGQMRLLEIARTLASGKELFLLDEPTAGVSPKMTSDVASIIKKLKQEGKTVIIVEHDLPFIRKICDRVIVLDVGEVALSGTPEEVHSSQKLKELYFGADPTE
ncbi:MAG: ABC transporter ATP-binding protein [Candidatus Peribacteraceae bacterium]